ncbi:MAG: TonB-dependent receptor [Bacteroidales bacterium]|nr:TonB-dependent receptor [Bacteroidales bacterium]
MKSKKLFKAISLLIVGVASAMNLHAQTNVSGVVTDQSGQPVMGATVLVPGTTRGTSTDFDGAYVINVSGAESLEFNCLGYKTQTIRLNGQAIIDVVLEEDRTNLDEVVIIGYGAQKRRDIVGAVETLNTEEISERTGSTMNISRTLQGAIPGLTLTFDDGKPTREANIRIRGAENSIGAGGSALVLLDGVEVSMNTINPDDIESITVLKDASSTAVYGARGTFGVILMTSKTPQKGAAKITYDGSVNIYQKTVRPDIVSNGYEWATNYHEAYVNGKGGEPTGINNKFPYSAEWLEELGRRDKDPNSSPWRVNSAGVYEYFGNTNWYDLFYKKYWVGHQHNITVQGGSDIANYYVSGRIFSSDGQFNVGNEKWNQYNVTAKGTVNIKPWLHVTETVNFMYQQTHEPGRYGTSTSMTEFLGQMFGEQLYPVAVPRNEDGTWTAAATSAYALFYDGSQYSEDRTTEFGTKTVVQLDIIKDVLWATADIGYRHMDRDRFWKTSLNSHYTAPGNEVTFPTTSSLVEKTYYSQRITGDATINYVPHLGKGHNLAFLLGWNIENYSYKSTALSRTGMMTDTPNWDLMEGDSMTINDNGTYDWGMVGYFYRISYNYKSKYLVETSGRYDGSSKFPSNQRWGFFPSASLGWRISEEGFMKSAEWLDNLKIRLSAGSAGNGLISDAYAYISTMSLSQSSMLNNGSTFKYTSAPTPIPDGLTWEKAVTYDLGLDFEALDGRLNFVGDIYRKNTVNMFVVGEELPAVYGNSAPKGNYADMKTNGWELSAGWRDSYMVGGKALSYNIKAAVWDNRSWITRYTSKTGTLPTIYSTAYYEGMEIGEIWGYVCNGLFQSDEEVANYADLSSFKQNSQVIGAGDPKFEDLNGDGYVNNGNNTIYDHGDLVKIGNTTPRFSYSFQGGISWNGIGINIMFQGVGKRDWYPAKESNWFWGQYSRPYSQYYPWFTSRWSEENRDAYWPRLVSYEAQSSKGLLSQANTRYLQSARYLRLKNITVDYNFPHKIVRKIGLKALKVYVSLENPCFFSPLHKYAGNYDPEGIFPGTADYSSQSKAGTEGYGDGDGYGVTKSYTIGLSITL